MCRRLGADDTRLCPLPPPQLLAVGPGEIIGTLSGSPPPVVCSPRLLVLEYSPWRLRRPAESLRGCRGRGATACGAAHHRALRWLREFDPPRPTQSAQPLAPACHRALPVSSELAGDAKSAGGQLSLALSWLTFHYHTLAVALVQKAARQPTMSQLPSQP